MQRVILVVSPDHDFVQQVHSHLEEGGRFQVTGATTAHEALNLANCNFYEVAILDGDLTDIPVAAFSRDLSALQSDIKILVYPPVNNPHDPALEGLVTNGFLTKPFSGPEIGGALSKLLSDQPVTEFSQVKVLDGLVKQWLEIPENGDQKANQILSTTTAQTVLIVIKGVPSASAGESDDNLQTKVKEFLSRYWREEENSELARFISFNGNGSERFVYVTKLVCNVVLVLVYVQTITLQQVRRELIRVKQDFQQNYPTTGELRQEIANKTLEKVIEHSKTLESMQPFTGAISQSELDALRGTREPVQTTTTPGISQDELDELNNLISALPPPDPRAEVEQGDPGDQNQSGEDTEKPPWLEELQSVVETDPDGEDGPATPVQMLENMTPIAPPFVETGTPEESLAALIPPTQQDGQTQKIETAEPLPEIDFKLPWESEDGPGGETSENNKVFPPVLNDASEGSFTQLLNETIDQPAQFPSIENGLAALSKEQAGGSAPEFKDFRFSYTCLILPNDRNQYLAKELSEKLSAIMPQFHLAQGWQLTNMTIRPQYLLWTVSVPVGVCPHQIIHDIRSLTSAHIYANFPEIARNKTSDDFWSSKYLAVSGAGLPPANLVADFVSQIWKDQVTATP